MECPIEDQLVLKSCHCATVLKDEEKTFVYIEGTQMDKTIAEDDTTLSDRVWHNMKPPKLFSADYFPAVTARQVQIKRIQLKGKRKLAGEDDTEVKREKISVSVHKKKSAIKFLSNTSLTSI